MVIIEQGSQQGKTENLLNIIGHRLDDGPYCPVLFIAPTEKMVRSVSQDRLDKMLMTTKSLWDKTEKGHRNKVMEKHVGGVRLGMSYAGSATELAGHPAGLVLVDERDRMSSDAGGEGDPVLLAKARTKNFPGSKVVVCSTPTIQGASPIHKLYETGTRGKWSWACPDCNEYFVPYLSLLSWAEGATPNQALESARLACPHCGSMIENKHKAEMNAKGRFEYHVPELDEHGNESREIPIGPEPPENRVASFWVSGICSPWQSFGDLAEVLLIAYQSGDPETIQATINTYFGELFVEKGDAPPWHEVMELIDPYAPLTIPHGVQIITIGCDVQKEGIFYTVKGWGYNSESWKLDHGFLHGDTDYDTVWLALTKILQRPMGEEKLYCKRLFVDSGYRAHQVYKFCRQHNGLAFPTKGHQQQDKPFRANKIDVTMGGDRVIKNGLSLFHLDTNFFKTWLYSRYRFPEGEVGGFHLDNATDEDYCKQITAEEKIVKPSGKILWKQIRKDNHYLDCEVGAAAAAASLGIHTLKPIEEAKKKPKPAKKKGGFIDAPRSGFIK